jgi:YHS domain-containing protein
MNSLDRIVRAILWAAVTGGLLSYMRQWNVDRGEMTGGRTRGKFSSSIHLHRDPVCGIYVSPEISFKLEKSGHITHFCSAGCRDRYSSPAARAARA